MPSCATFVAVSRLSWNSKRNRQHQIRNTELTQVRSMKFPTRRRTTVETDGIIPTATTPLVDLRTATKALFTLLTAVKFQCFVARIRVATCAKSKTKRRERIMADPPTSALTVSQRVIRASRTIPNQFGNRERSLAQFHHHRVLHGQATRDGTLLLPPAGIEAYCGANACRYQVLRC